MQPAPRQRHAFTTIELLIAISIIVVLAGMVFVGFKVVGSGGRMRGTRVTLETAHTLLSEVQSNKGLPGIKAVFTRPPNQASGVKPYYFAFPPLPAATPSSAPTGTPNPPVPTPIPAPVDATKKGNLSNDLYAASTHDIRFQSDAVIRTQMIMQRIQSMPTNRATIAQLPANSFLTWTNGTPTVGALGTKLQIPLVQLSPQRFAPTPPVLTDAWGNPIIFVPPAGLSGVTFKDRAASTAAGFIVTSARIRETYTAGVTTPSSTTYYNFDAGASSFWASAGPDGDFTTGDDNIYSFEGY